MPRSDYPPRDGYILTKDEEDAIGSAASSPPMSPRQFWRRQGMGLGGKETNKRWQYTVAGVVALLLIYWMATPSTPADPWSVVESKRQTGPRASYWDVREKPKVYEAKDLLSPAAPSTTYLDALRSDLRYLTCDSWSGLTGQFLTVLSLLHLAQLTQRVAVIPSWRDNGHYGEVVARMSLIFDVDKFRRETGMLFVEMDDVKPNVYGNVSTPLETIGCHKGSWFENAVNFGDHNLHMDVYDVKRPGDDNVVWSYESYTLFDYQFESRFEAAKRVANETGRVLAPNLALETADSGLLCYTNLWDLRHAGNGLKPDSVMSKMLPDPLRGLYPEWQHIGRFIDFAPAIWDIAIAAVRQTLNTRRSLPPLLTVHVRRGDFKEWCDAGSNCVASTPDAYVPEVERLRASMPRNTVVLVTTDETEDLEFLAGFKRLGWYRIDHDALGTRAILKQRFGVYDRWADGAVDQAILSLGAAFVGTQGSQVSLVTELRVRSWNDAPTGYVARPGVPSS